MTGVFKFLKYSLNNWPFRWAECVTLYYLCLSSFCYWNYGYELKNKHVHLLYKQRSHSMIGKHKSAQNIVWYYVELYCITIQWCPKCTCILFPKVHTLQALVFKRQLIVCTYIVNESHESEVWSITTDVNEAKVFVQINMTEPRYKSCVIGWFHKD